MFCRSSLFFAALSMSLLLAAETPVPVPTVCLEASEVLSAADVDMFPAAQPGCKQVVIRLPELQGDAMIEIVARRTAMVDAVNRHSFAGKLKRCNLEGWGYDFFEMEVSEHCMSTRMVGPEADMKPRPVAVPVQGEGFRGLRYNHRLPLVVYVPQDVEIGYRVWTPGAELKP